MGISSPSSDGRKTSVGVDAMEDGTLDRGLDLGDWDLVEPDRPRRDARRWARSWAKFIARPFSFVLVPSSARVLGELGREWIVRPLTGGELELMSTEGNDRDPTAALSVDGMLAVGNGFWGNEVVLVSQRVSDVDLSGVWSRLDSLTENLTRFELFRMPAFLFLP